MLKDLSMICNTSDCTLIMFISELFCLTAIISDGRTIVMGKWVKSGRKYALLTVIIRQTVLSYQGKMGEGRKGFETTFYLSLWVQQIHGI